MTKAQRQDLQDCQDANCKYMHRCKVHWGRRCNRQGGKKVPRIRVVQQYSWRYEAVADG